MEQVLCGSACAQSVCCILPLLCWKPASGFSLHLEHNAQPTCRKSLRALTLAWPFSFPLCHFPVSGSYFLRHTAVCFRCSLCPGQSCPSIACYNYLCSFGAAQRSSKERPPALSPPSSSLDPCPPRFFLKISVSDYCVCPSFMTIGIVDLLNVATLAPDTYPVQNK